MGNSYPNARWRPDKSITDLLSSGKGVGLQDILLRRDLREKCYTVNVGTDIQTNAWNEHHKIAFDVEKAEDYYLIVLFPCHPDVRKRTLYTYNYGSVTALNREINARLRDSLQVSFEYETSRMVIICGSVIYKLTNFIGTGYIVWASYVNTTNHNQVPNQILEQIPVFVHMDGYNQFESVLRILPEVEAGTTVETLNVANTTFYIPFKVFLWTDEADPRQQQRRPSVSVATFEQVVDQCSDDDDGSNTPLAHEPIPFSASEAESSTSGTPRAAVTDFTALDSDDELEALGSLSGALYTTASTPRVATELPGFVGLKYGGAATTPDERN